MRVKPESRSKVRKSVSMFVLIEGAYRLQDCLFLVVGDHGINVEDPGGIMTGNASEYSPRSLAYALHGRFYMVIHRIDRNTILFSDLFLAQSFFPAHEEYDPLLFGQPVQAHPDRAVPVL